MLMSAADYRDSLRAYTPKVFVNGARVESVAYEPLLAPGIAGVGVTYDFALKSQNAMLMTARQGTSGKTVNRMLHIDETSTDLLYKLEAVRLVCRESGCAVRYLTHDAFNGIFQGTKRTDDAHGTDYHQRFVAYMHEVQDRDQTVGVAMTDAKGDRSKRPGDQANPDVYVRIAERRADGIVIRGTKAIVTGAPYMHAFLVMPCRTMTRGGRRFAVCCAVPVDAPGVTIVAKPAGRPGEAAAKILGQIRAVGRGRDLRRRVSCRGTGFSRRRDGGGAGVLTTSYATHHRHSCIGARAGFGDLLIGAGALMIEANGLDPDRHGHIRDAMVDLIKIVEGFFACGVASSVYCQKDPGRLGDARHGVRQYRQAAARDADLRHAPARPLRLGRARGGAARARRGPQPRDRRLARRRAGRAARRARGAAHGGGALRRGPHRLASGRLVLAHLAPWRRLARRR
jgi:4-hydroxybutyryl-CoA dehydratase/vinylacetyl-CoA-Delta-isomerase